MRTIKPSNPCYLWAPAVLLHRAEEVSILDPEKNHHDFEDEAQDGGWLHLHHIGFSWLWAASTGVVKTDPAPISIPATIQSM